MDDHPHQIQARTDELQAGKLHDASREAAAKLHTAFELFDAAEEIQRLNLRRRHPTATDEEIETLLGRWISKVDEPQDAPWTLRLRPDLDPRSR